MKLLVFGDSHSSFFNITQEMLMIEEDLKGVRFNVVTIPGSTISGFGKRKSTLNTRETFLDKIKSENPNYVCFALGQVDVELGYYYKQVVKGNYLVPEIYFRDLVDYYIDAIKSVQEESGIKTNSIIIKGINVSVLTKCRQKALDYTEKIITENIKSEDEIKQYRKKLKHVYPSNLERIDNHLRFNLLLKAKCKSLGYHYFDINNDICCRDTGHVKYEYIPAGNDHHLVNSIQVRLMYAKSVLRVIYNLRAIA